MRVRFWGTRGSLPRSLTAAEIRRRLLRVLEVAQEYDLSRESVRESLVDSALPFALRGSYGGNTSCVQIEAEGDSLLCDAGTGLRDFGQQVMASQKCSGHPAPRAYHLLISHVHWDHIQGFPFFTPAYIPGNTITIYGCHGNLAEAFVYNQEPPFFPVPLSGLGADIRFERLCPGQDYEINGFRVRGIEQDHPGVSYGYSIERSGKKVVYSTDSEHKYGEDWVARISRFIDFFAGADLMIFDAQYSLAEAEVHKKDWGHSSNMVGVELAVQAGARHLALFHSEPAHDDQELDRILDNTRQYARYYASGYPLVVSMAYDGLEIHL